MKRNGSNLTERGGGGGGGKGSGWLLFDVADVVDVVSLTGRRLKLWTPNPHRSESVWLWKRGRLLPVCCRFPPPFNYRFNSIRVQYRYLIKCWMEWGKGSCFYSSTANWGPLIGAAAVEAADAAAAAKGSSSLCCQGKWRSACAVPSNPAVIIWKPINKCRL